MTAIPTFAIHDMDFLNPNEATDTMDLASSPNMMGDDPDLDYDPMRDPSVEPNLENMMDVPGQPDKTVPDTTSQNGEALLDDDMFDEETLQQQAEEILEYNMNPPQQDDLQDALEDEILYEDEPETKAREHDTPANQIGDAEDEDLLDEYEPELDHVELTDSAKKQEQHTTTNDSKYPYFHTLADGSVTAEDAEHAPQDLNQGHSDVPATADHAAKPEENPANVQADQAANPHPELNDQIVAGVDDTHRSTGDAPGDAEEHEQNGSFDVALHPVKVLYQDSEISLFPPQQNDETETFFLADTTLAHASIDKLLKACRDVLAGTIEDDDEMVLDIAAMGLHICEDSKYANQLTLSDVLDVYLALNHNDNIDSPEPLVCLLSSRVCLASQYDYLLGAAQQGRVFTEIANEHMGQDEYEAADEQQHDSHEGLDDQLQTGDEHDAATGDTKELPDEKSVDLSTQEHVTSNKDQEEEGKTYNSQDDGINGLPQAEIQQPVLSEMDVSAATSTAVGGSADKNDDADLAHDNEGVKNSPAKNATPGKDPNEPENKQNVDKHDELHEDDLVDFDDDLTSSHNLDTAHERDSGEANETDIKSSHTSADKVNFLTETGGNKPTNASDSVAVTDSLPLDDDDLIDLSHDGQEADGADHSLGKPFNHGHESRAEEQEPDEDLFEDIDDTVTNGSANTDVTKAPQPITPSKSQATKRKMVEDEDEFEFIDTETPEKKRGRSS